MPAERCDVILLGTILPGFTAEAVGIALGALIKRDVPVAKQLLSGHPSKVKTGVSLAVGNRYIDAFTAIGASAVLESETIDIDPELDQRIVQRKKSEANHRESTQQSAVTRLALWNPVGIVNWSVIFTPAFGSYLLMLNWRALGREDNASDSKHWFYASILVLVGYVFSPTITGLSSLLANGIAILYLVTWYIFHARNQDVYIKRTFAGGYERKPWAKALTIAGIIAMGALVIATVLGGLAGSSTSQRLSQPMTQASGVSSANPVAPNAPDRLDGGSQKAGFPDDPNGPKTVPNPYANSDSGKWTEASTATGAKEYQGSQDQEVGTFRLLCKFERDDGSVTERLFTVDEVGRTVDGIAVAILDKNKIVYDMPRIEGIRNIVVIDRSTGYLTVTRLSAPAGVQPVVLRAMCAKVPMKLF